MLGQPSRPGADRGRRSDGPAGGRRVGQANRWRRTLADRLGPEAALLLQRRHGERRLSPGDYVARAGEVGADFFVVKLGVVGLYRISEADGLDVQDFCYPGDLVVPTRPGVAWGLDARAVGAVRLLVFAFADLRTWCASDPELGCRLFEILCGELARRRERLRRHWCLPVQARLAAFLLEAGERIGVRSGRAMALQMPIPRDEMANYLSTRTETVCRVLSGWKADGLIEMDTPRHFRVPDPARLQARAAASQEARRKTL